MVVNQTFTGDVNQLMSELRRLEAQNKKIHDTQAQGARQSKKHHDDAMSYAKEQVGFLKGAALEYLSLEGAIGSVTTAYSEMRERVKGIAEAQKSVNEELLRGISLSGEIAKSAEITARLKSIQGVTPLQTADAFSGVRSGASQETSLARRLDLTEHVAKFGKLGIGLDLRDLGEKSGQISEMFPGKSPEDVVDLTRVAEGKLGNRADRFFSARQSPSIRHLVKSGAYGSEDQAFAEMLTAGIENPTLAKELDSALEKGWQKPHGHEAHTAEGKAKVRLAMAKSKAEQLDILKSLAPEIAAGLGVAGISGLNPDRVAANLKAVREAHGDFEREFAGIAKTPAGRRAEVEQEHAVEAKKAAVDPSDKEMAEIYASIKARRCCNCCFAHDGRKRHA